MKESIFELQVLEELVGESLFWAIIEAHKGTRLYIPKSPSPCLETRRLVGIVGDEVYAMLCQSIGGSYMYFPMKLVRSRRDERIRQLYYEQHVPMREIARRVHVSEACVQSVLRAD